jgi:hypothetical protein
MLCEVSGPRPPQFPSPRFERRLVTEGDIWRYDLALNKFTGRVSVVWVARTARGQRLFLDGCELETRSSHVDFPFFEYAQAPIGRVQTEEPAFGILAYKCRSTGRLFVRRVSEGTVGPERALDVGPIVGGASLTISKDRVLIRVDRLRDGVLAPTIIESHDGGNTFLEPREIDLSAYDSGFCVVPGYTAPITDKGYGLHVPIFMSDGRESVAANYVLEKDLLVEAVRVPGIRPIGSLEKFPSTLGSGTLYGNGVTDGHGLIMVLGSEGKLYSSNSSSGGVHFPESALLNYEMPQIAAFDASECYSSGLHPNYVSMDYIYVEEDSNGQLISPVLHIETWDMPLPLPRAKAEARGADVLLTVLSDADLEPGKVVVDFDDPTIGIIDVKVADLRHAIISTDSKDLIGKRLTFDVHTLFHRHFGGAVVESGESASA